MYKILHLLFGWDYVLWEMSLTGGSGICRIKRAANNRFYIMRYPAIEGIFILDEPDPYITITYLTCNKSKYTINGAINGIIYYN